MQLMHTRVRIINLRQCMHIVYYGAQNSVVWMIGRDCGADLEDLHFSASFFDVIIVIVPNDFLE